MFLYHHFITMWSQMREFDFSAVPKMHFLDYRCIKNGRVRFPLCMRVNFRRKKLSQTPHIFFQLCSCGIKSCDICTEESLSNVETVFSPVCLNFTETHSSVQHGNHECSDFSDTKSLIQNVELFRLVFVFFLLFMYPNDFRIRILDRLKNVRRK